MNNDITIRQAQEASDILGWDRTIEICGPGGLSGATAEALRRLVVTAIIDPPVVAR